jgi:HSP20 family molecular chaperone IbpA
LFDYPEFGATELFEGWQPAVDVQEDKDNFIVKAEMPGLKREDINVSIHQNTLVLCGERKREEEKKEEGYYRSERYFGKFQRSIPLPQAVDAQKIEAKVSRRRAHSETAKERAGESQTDRSQSRLTARY